jgi:hypothetical protein
MKRFLTWLGTKLFKKNVGPESVLRQTTRRRNPTAGSGKKTARAPGLVEFESELGGRIDDGGPGKNVLIRNKYVREDTGTHDTLKIIDDTLLEDEEEFGIDPYNTGRFDRSQSWNLRTKK